MQNCDELFSSIANGATNTKHISALLTGVFCCVVSPNVLSSYVSGKQFPSIIILWTQTLSLFSVCGNV